MKKFSILNVLLAITLFCTCLALYIAQTNFNQLATETQSLRDETGQFEISDTSRIHIRALNPDYDSIWRFQAYIPDDSQLELGFGRVTITQEGLIDFDSVDTGNRRFKFVDFPWRGELSLAFRLIEYQGEMHHRFTIFDRNDSTDIDWENPYSNGSFTQCGVGSDPVHLLWDVAPAI